VPKILAFDWLSARARHLHFVSLLKRKADFELDFELFNTRTSLQNLSLNFNGVGWPKWYGNRVKARREIPEGKSLIVLRERANGYLF